MKNSACLIEFFISFLKPAPSPGFQVMVIIFTQLFKSELWRRHGSFLISPFPSCFTSNSSATPARSALKYIWNLTFLLSPFPGSQSRAITFSLVFLLSCSVRIRYKIQPGKALWSLKLNYEKKLHTQVIYRNHTSEYIYIHMHIYARS